MTTLVRVPPTTEIFDSTRDALLHDDVHAGMGRLRTSLRRLRSGLPTAEWREIGAELRAHRLHDVLLQSPFTRRAYAKPRGYAGDAVLMDLIYGIAPPGDLTALGGVLYGYEFDSPCFQSVRTRRAILAREIDAVAVTQGDARVLSVACGHLREIEWSRAARAGSVSVTAVDQDRDSLELLADRYRGYQVTALPATVGDLLRRTVRFSAMDLIYAAGLYDYLDADIARTLTATLFRMLRGGGRLLLANFTPATSDAAFMEAVMDWHLVYRTPEQLRALCDSIPAGDLLSIEQFADDQGQVAYLRAVKR
jgi:hypothetical protein